MLGQSLPGGAGEAELRAALQVDLEAHARGRQPDDRNRNGCATRRALAAPCLARLLRPGPHVTYIIFLLIIAFFVDLRAELRDAGDTAGAVGRITAVVTIMAVGMTFVIVCGEIDLSVGSHVSFAAMVVAMLLYNGVPGWLAAPAVLLLGAVRRRDQRPHGHQAAHPVVPRDARHAERAARPGAQLHRLDAGADRRYHGFVEVLAGGTLLGVPAPIWWTVATVLVGFYLLHMSLFGRRALRHRRQHASPHASRASTPTWSGSLPSRSAA